MAEFQIMPLYVRVNLLNLEKWQNVVFVNIKDEDKTRKKFRSKPTTFDDPHDIQQNSPLLTTTLVENSLPLLDKTAWKQQIASKQQVVFKTANCQQIASKLQIAFKTAAQVDCQHFAAKKRLFWSNLLFRWQFAPVLSKRGFFSVKCGWQSTCVAVLKAIYSCFVQKRQSVFKTATCS